MKKFLKVWKYFKIIPKWKGFEFKITWWFLLAIAWGNWLNAALDGIVNGHWEITLWTWHF